MRKFLDICFVISLLLLGIHAQNNDETIDTLENANLYSKIGSLKSTLDQTAYPKIRFAYDTSRLLNITEEQQTAIIEAIETSFNFFYSFVGVKHPSQSISVANSTFCMDYNFSPSQLKKIWTDVDMVFFLSSHNDDSSTILSQGVSCYYSDADIRPIAGLLRFNQKYLKSSYDSFQFQKLTKTLIHSIFHAICFHRSHFIRYSRDYTPSVDYNIETQPQWVAFPNVLDWAKTHFGCNSLDKLYLEDAGNNQSHWESSLLFNDLMTFSSIPNKIWGCINNALLNDSGWYYVNKTFCEENFWGKNKGCEFVNQKCQMSPPPEEFCNSGRNNINAPLGFYYSGYGKCGNNNISGHQSDNDNCKYLITFKKTQCNRFQNNQEPSTLQMRQAGSIFDWDSMAFQSNLRPENESFTQALESLLYVQCYKQKCFIGDNGRQWIQITVGTDTLYCHQEDQILQISGYSGQLKCPNISDFCSKQYGCDNHCNKGGFCMNKKCVCSKGFSGPNCVCGRGQYWNGTDCQPCSKKCSQCIARNKCQICKPEYQLKGFTCILIQKALTLDVSP